MKGIKFKRALLGTVPLLTSAKGNYRDSLSNHNICLKHLVPESLYYDLKKGGDVFLSVKAINI
jgi:hypothetical protein